MNLNKVFVLGRVTANPELRSTPGGQSVTTFSIATNRVWTDQAGKKQEATEFHNIVAWGRTAEIANQFLVKGAMVLIEGRLQTRKWQDKQGQTRSTTDIICERMQLGPKPSGASGASGSYPAKQHSAPAAASDAGAQQPEEEEIPVINVDEEDIKAEDLPF